MSKTATITTRIDPELKTNVESVFAQLGLTTTQAITLFFKQVEMHQGLPFAVRVFNPTTLRALEESENYNSLPSFDNLDELFSELEI
jgi:DNA-damage-inducible protein J